jgi:hypothetical protein
VLLVHQQEQRFAPSTAFPQAAHVIYALDAAAGAAAGCGFNSLALATHASYALDAAAHEEARRLSLLCLCGYCEQ